MSDTQRQYITVATTADLPPGERLVVELGRKWIVLFNVGGEYFAIEDEGTHEEVPLSEGALDGHMIECHKHGACFDIRTGAVTAPPAVVGVKTYPVRIDGDEIQIGR